MPSAKPSTQQDVLVVAGMHRSGTSAIARVLSLAGGRLPERVMEPGPDNPLGFWEPHEMVTLNDTILASVGSRWDDIFGHRVAAVLADQPGQFDTNARAFLAENYSQLDLAILKDPRASLAIPFWDAQLRAVEGVPAYIIMVRHPLEVARSIAARSGASEANSAVVWASYMLAVERDTRGARRIFIDYSDLLHDWRGVVARIETLLERPLSQRSPEADAAIDGFLSSAMRHHTAEDNDLVRPDLWPEVATVYGWLRAATGDEATDPAAMDHARFELEKVAVVAGPSLKDLRAEAAAFPVVQAALTEARTEIAALRNLANQFHAEADHNGRHLVAAQEQVAHYSRQLALAQAEATVARQEASQLLPVRRDIALAEAALLRQTNRNKQLDEALEKERRVAVAHAAHSASDHARRETERALLEADRARLAIEQSQVDQERATYQETLAAWQAREAELSEQISAAQALAASSRNQVENLERQHRQLTATHERVVSSWVWRLARPARVVAKRLKAMTADKAPT